MLAYKVDPELNQVSEVRNSDNLIISCDYDLGSSDKLTVFSKCKNASLWIDDKLINDKIPLVRINKKLLKLGVEFIIIPLKSYLRGSIYLVESTGISRYNLIFKYNE